MDRSYGHRTAAIFPSHGMRMAREVRSGEPSARDRHPAFTWPGEHTGYQVEYNRNGYCRICIAHRGPAAIDDSEVT